MRFSKEMVDTLNRDMNVELRNKPESEPPAFMAWFDTLEYEEPQLFNMFKEIFTGHTVNFRHVGVIPFDCAASMLMLTAYYTAKAYETHEEIVELEKLLDGKV